MSLTKIEWIKADSSNVAEYAYVPASERLYLRFHSGNGYCYSGVPEPEYLALTQAKSIGRFVTLKIVGFYPYERVF